MIDGTPSLSPTHDLDRAPWPHEGVWCPLCSKLRSDHMLHTCQRLDHPIGFCRKSCSGGHEEAVAPVYRGIRQSGRRTVRPQEGLSSLCDYELSLLDHGH